MITPDRERREPRCPEAPAIDVRQLACPSCQASDELLLNPERVDECIIVTLGGKIGILLASFQEIIERASPFDG